ncbi:YoaK family protein [Methylobacterium sp. P5_C11]
MADYGNRTGGGASERKPEPPADKSFPADPRTRIPFAIALAALAGCADSIGFLEFSQLFMSFMSGNTTRFGVAVSNGDWENVTRVASTISIFCFGAFLGTLIAAWVGRWRLAVLLTLQALLLAGGLLMPWGTFAYPLHAYPIVLALGLQNATLQDDGGRSLALTYVTGAVVRFGTGCANLLLGTVAPSFWIQAPLWAGLTTGAVVGGLLDIRYGESAFLFPAALAAILALIAIVLTIAKPGSTLVAGSSPAPDASPKAAIIDAIH